MKENKRMKYYLRKSAYGLAAVSVAVLVGGSVVSAHEVSNDPSPVVAKENSEKNEEAKKEETLESAKEKSKKVEKVDKEVQLETAKKDALEELEALGASSLIKKIADSAKTIEGLEEFLKQTLPSLRAIHKDKLEEELKREVAEEHPEILENEEEGKVENTEDKNSESEAVQPEKPETEVETTDSDTENSGETTEPHTEEMVESLTKDTTETVDNEKEQEKAKQNEVAQETNRPQETKRIAESAAPQAMPRSDKASHYASTLPVTGEDNSPILTAIAMSVIAASGMVAYGTKRKKQ